MSFNMLVEFSLRGQLDALRAIPLRHAQTLRKSGLELLAHMLLDEFRRVPSLQKITLAAVSSASVGGTALGVSYVGAAGVMRTSDDYSAAFPGELFGLGEFSLSNDHPAVQRARTNEDGMNAHLALVAEIAHALYCAFPCSPEQD
jgi:hypothetical protein